MEPKPPEMLDKIPQTENKMKKLVPKWEQWAALNPNEIVAKKWNEHKWT